LPVNLAGSFAVLGVAPSANAVFLLQKNGVTFATLTFLAGQTNGSFVAAVATSFTAGQILSIVAPSPQDLLLADLGFGFAGLRG
jgi:hypothetical protein